MQDLCCQIYIHAGKLNLVRITPHVEMRATAKTFWSVEGEKFRNSKFSIQTSIRCSKVVFPATNTEILFIMPFCSSDSGFYMFTLMKPTHVLKLLAAIVAKLGKF